MVSVSIRKVLKTSDRTYDAILDVTYKERTIKLVIPGLVREPKDVKVEVIANKEIKLELINDEGKGYATCYIPIATLEKGYLELICPKGSGWVISKEEHT
ncbi:MAG: hypothetical protein DRO18_07920 [Thermoprotei archaeon]|nr:MAG: hypothetical protein DRO18_07920 [Thermoprotei archaeon]